MRAHSCIQFIFIVLILGLSCFPSHSLAESAETIITGEVLEYSRGIYTARGNVVITKENRNLKASRIVLDNNTGDLIADGEVEFRDGDNILTSQSLLVNIRTDYIRIEQGRIFIKEDNYHIEGDSIERLSDDEFSIRKASFTTCDDRPPCWKFSGSDITIQMNHFLTAKNVFFAIKDIPVFYLPYLALPVLLDRQTGFLIPRVGYNTGEGLKVNNAFFWAISGSQDATISADYYGEKGWGGGLEYRYLLARDTGGQFNGYYLDDIETGRSRWDIKYNHRHHLSRELSARLRVNYLSDETLYKDISEDPGERLQRSQDSDIYINRRWDNASFHLWGQYTQNLEGDDEGIFQRLPEASFTVMDKKISRLPLYWNLTSSVSRWEETDIGATRLHIAPTISARLFEKSGITFIPEAGTDQTLYYIDGNNEPVESGLYRIGASLSAKLNRSYSSDAGYLKHFVEPLLRYEYADGSIDAGLPFPEPDPQYTSFIRNGARESSSEDRNMISVSIVNRLLSHGGQDIHEILYLKLAQMYSIDSVSIQDGFSDLRIESIIRPHKIIDIDIDMGYSYEDHELKSAGADLALRAEKGYLIIGQRYLEDPAIHFLKTSAGIRIKETAASVDLWYDQEDHRLGEAYYSLKYFLQCWGITFSYRYRPDEEQFNVLVTLKGIGSVGGN